MRQSARLRLLVLCLSYADRIPVVRVLVPFAAVVAVVVVVLIVHATLSVTSLMAVMLGTDPGAAVVRKPGDGSGSVDQGGSGGDHGGVGGGTGLFVLAGK